MFAMIGKILTAFFFTWALLLFHSCMPFGFERDILSLSRADDEVIRDFTASFRNSIFLSAVKRCGHCGKIVEAEISEGQCMFREISSMDPRSPEYPEKLVRMRKQLQGEAGSGYGPAHFLLGVMAENGLFGMNRDEISAARRYRLYSESGDPRGPAELACFWIRIGENLPAAVDLLKKALAADPRDTGFGMYLSEACSLLGRNREAFEAAKRAYYYSPVDSEERLAIESVFLTRLLSAAEEIGADAALSQIGDMIYISPGNAEFKYVRCLLLLMFGRCEEAEAERKKLEHIYPEESLGILQARICAARGDFPQAYEVLDRLLKTNPGSMPLRIARFQLLVQENREKDAFAELEKYVKSDPDPAEILLFRGHLYMERHQWDLAEKDFRSALENVKNELTERKLRQSLNSLQELQELFPGAEP